MCLGGVFVFGKSGLRYEKPATYWKNKRYSKKKQGVSINALILQVLWNYINKKGA